MNSLMRHPDIYTLAGNSGMIMGMNVTNLTNNIAETLCYLPPINPIPNCLSQKSSQFSPVLLDPSISAIFAATVGCA